MTSKSLDSFKSRTTITVGDKTYTYFSIPLAEKNGLQGVSTLPHSMKVVLENLLRFEDGDHRHQGRHRGDRRLARHPHVRA